MIESEHLARVRRKRQHRLMAAKLLSRLVTDPAEVRLLQDWPVLLTVPEWCFWRAEQRERLIFVSGALFVGPSMRLWIDSKRIKQARALLGERCFELVMSAPSVPQELIPLPKIDDVQTLLQSTGSSVLLGSMNSPVQRIFVGFLYESAGVLPQKVALSLKSEAMSIVLAADKEKESS